MNTSEKRLQDFSRSQKPAESKSSLNLYFVLGGLSLFGAYFTSQFSEGGTFLNHFSYWAVALGVIGFIVADLVARVVKSSPEKALAFMALNKLREFNIHPSWVGKWKKSEKSDAQMLFGDLMSRVVEFLIQKAKAGVQGEEGLNPLNLFVRDTSLESLVFSKSGTETLSLTISFKMGGERLYAVSVLVAGAENSERTISVEADGLRFCSFKLQEKNIQLGSFGNLLLIGVYKELWSNAEGLLKLFSERLLNLSAGLAEFRLLNGGIEQVSCEVLPIPENVPVNSLPASPRILVLKGGLLGSNGTVWKVGVSTFFSVYPGRSSQQERFVITAKKAPALGLAHEPEERVAVLAVTQSNGILTLLSEGERPSTSLTLTRSWRSSKNVSKDLLQKAVELVCLRYQIHFSDIFVSAEKLGSGEWAVTLTTDVGKNLRMFDAPSPCPLLITNEIFAEHIMKEFLTNMNQLLAAIDRVIQRAE